MLVYAAAINADSARSATARSLLRTTRRESCLSVQTLSEFSVVALRNGLPPDTCRVIVAEYRRSWTILLPDPATVELALTRVGQHSLSYWDSLLWAVAKQADLTEILSEDGPIGTVVGGILYRNPFSPRLST
ncbi:MAG: PIN domain-containing protein [Clostridia bacterium]